MRKQRRWSYTLRVFLVLFVLSIIAWETGSFDAGVDDGYLKSENSLFVIIAVLCGGLMATAVPRSFLSGRLNILITATAFTLVSGTAFALVAFFTRIVQADSLSVALNTFGFCMIGVATSIIIGLVAGSALHLLASLVLGNGKFPPAK